MEFNIGDKVYHKRKESNGVILDKLSSVTGMSSYLYLVSVEGERIFCNEDQLEHIAAAVTYSYDIKYEDGVVVAAMYEEYADGRKYELCRGHGHILYNNAVGIAQAASYALKRIYTTMNGGSVRLDRTEDDYE